MCYGHHISFQLFSRPVQNLKQQWLLVFWNKIQTHKRFKKTGYQSNTTKQLNQKQMSILHLIFHCLTVVFSAWKGSLPPKFTRCFVIINSILLTFQVFGSVQNFFPDKQKNVSIQKTGQGCHHWSMIMFWDIYKSIFFLLLAKPLVSKRTRIIHYSLVNLN